jgi:hypothetical protein
MIAVSHADTFAGAKAQLFSAFYGPTKVVPLL